MEICICAAILCNGKIFRGHRHPDAFTALNNELSWELSRRQIGMLTKVEGFLTTGNRFVEREEGLILQKAAGIPSADPGGYRGNKLYSEDLY